MAEFQKKLEDRRKKQDERLSASMDNVAAAVMGKRLSRQAQRREVARFAIEEILKYYGYHLDQDEAELPETVEDTEEMLDFFLRPYGMMYRRVSMEKDWYKNSVGAMLGRLKEDGTVVALLPGRMRGYSYLDPRTEKRVKVDRRTRERIDTEAVCFYKPLPQRTLHISDLLMYIRRQISLSDGLIYFAMIIVPVLLGLMSPMFTQWLFGKVLNYGNVQVLLALAVFMVSFSVCRFFVNVCKSMIKTRLYTKQDTAVEAAVMNRMVNLPTSFFKDYSAGEIQQRSAYIGDLCRLLFETVADTGLTALFSLMYIGQVFTYTPALAVPSILVVAATASVLLITTLMQMRDRRKRMRLHSELSGMTYSMITGIQKVKLTGSEKTMMSRWARLYADEARVEYNPPTFLKLSDTITLGISLLGTLAIYAAALGSHIATADYYAFNTAYGMMMAAVSSVSAIAVSIANIKTTFEMTKPILETQPETSENREAVGALNGEIDIQHVTFRYQDDMPNVLDDFSLHISPGEYIAIVGTTGCGKSTLMRLLLGFETPQKGAVYYDRRDISKVDIKSLRRRIGVVMQDGRLFQGDILTNITISSPHATVDDAWDAAEKAAVADDIRELPMGMYTMVAEGQGGLSGGQRQRLLIARAIAAKPSVLMFDEATSALDNATQKKVSRSIDGLGCTRLVIAHRLSTIRNADRIVALDNGRIIEDGTYDELIAKNGFFAELIRRQRLDTEEKAG